MDLQGLLKAIENAESINDIKEAKDIFGWSEMRSLVYKASLKREREIKALISKERKERDFTARKKLLNANVGEMIYYIGLPYKKLTKNKPCRLIKVNRSKALVQFKGDIGQWNIPIMELHPEKTNQKHMIMTEKGFKMI